MADANTMTDADWAAIGMKPPPKRVTALTAAELAAARAKSAPQAPAAPTGGGVPDDRLGLKRALARRLAGT